MGEKAFLREVLWVKMRAHVGLRNRPGPPGGYGPPGAPLDPGRGLAGPPARPAIGDRRLIALRPNLRAAVLDGEPLARYAARQLGVRYRAKCFSFRLKKERRPGCRDAAGRGRRWEDARAGTRSN